MRVIPTIVNGAVFIQCYDTFEGLTELASAQYLREYVDRHLASYKPGELEENENGVYYFQLYSRMEDIEYLLRNYSKCDVIKYFQESFNVRIKRIKESLLFNYG